MKSLGAEEKSIVAELLNDLRQTWQRRHGRRTATKAAELVFWRDGMRGTLQRIANGTANSEDFAELKLQLDETQQDVEQITGSLSGARYKLHSLPNGPELAERLDAILYGPVGKMAIRSDIEEIIKNYDREGTQHLAISCCNAIDQFNRDVQRFHALQHD